MAHPYGELLSTFIQECTAEGMEAMESWGQEGIVLDLDRLERQAEDLDLDDFADAIRQTRGRLGRYLVLQIEEITGRGPIGESAVSLAEALAGCGAWTCSGQDG
jgi:hypothetical protein